MTFNHVCGTIDSPIVDALHTMHEGKFLHLPVVDRDGNIVSVVDGIHITHAAVYTGLSNTPHGTCSITLALDLKVRWTIAVIYGLHGAVAGFNTDAVVLLSIVILVGLFSIQRFGSGKVGFLFAPALALWFFSIGSIGLYNVIKYDISVLRALNPAYIYFFFKRNNLKAWSSVGGVVLCITGAEAMFADLGHFSVKSTDCLHVCSASLPFLSLLWPSCISNEKSKFS